MMEQNGLRRHIPVVEEGTTLLELDTRDISYLQTEWDEIDVSVNGNNAAIRPGRSVGVVGLPSGDSLLIEPKLDCELLHFLAYDDRIDESLVLEQESSGFRLGEDLLEVLARLFLNQLEQIVKQGLREEYDTKEETERFLRGQLDIQRQIQKQGRIATTFECRYDERTADTLANRILLASTSHLVTLLSDGQLRSSLRRYRESLRGRVGRSSLPEDPFGQLHLSRLHTHYRPAIDLSRVILADRSIQGFDEAESIFPSLTFAMYELFENSIVKGVDKAVDSARYRVTENDLGELVENTETGEKRRLEPDFIVRSRDDSEVVLVGDVKWKESPEPTRNDLYQMATYQAEAESPGLLIYPTEDEPISTRFEYPDESPGKPKRGPLYVGTVQVGAEGYPEFTHSLETDVADHLQSVMPFAGDERGEATAGGQRPLEDWSP